ncbi:MAG: sigma-70 family RNA polymerase sigma factor [Flavobacteriaceae bacterium]
MKGTFEHTKEFLEHQFKEHYAFLVITAFTITRNQEASKDIVQDFFMSYWSKQEKIRIKTSFRAYATRSVKNLSLQYLSKQGKDLRLLRDLELQKQAPTVEMERPKNLYTKSRELLEQLPEARKRIFLAYVVQGLSYSEIAETYNISINTVKTQMKRAYAFFRENASEDFLCLMIFILGHGL